MSTIPQRMNQIDPATIRLMRQPGDSSLIRGMPSLNENRAPSSDRNPEKITNKMPPNTTHTTTRKMSNPDRPRALCQRSPARSAGEVVPANLSRAASAYLRKIGGDIHHMRHS